MQPKFQRKMASPRQFFCQIKRETPLPPERLPPLFTFPLSRGYAFPPFRRSAAAGERDPPGTGDVRHDMACAMPPSGGGDAGAHRPGQEGQGHQVVSLPLLTPRTFLCAATPFGRAAKRGLRGLGSGRRFAYRTLLCPEFTLRDLPRITVRGQTVPGGGNAHAMSWRTSPFQGGRFSPPAAHRCTGGRYTVC